MNYNFKQIRFFSENDTRNSPNATIANLSSNFFNDYTIIQLGIQTMPGTKFIINNSELPIIVGCSGIFELNLENTNMFINNLVFDETSLHNISDNEYAFLCIDILYYDASGED